MERHAKLSILLVDDDPMVIRVLNRILSEFAPLRFATSGRDALKLAREQVPDLVLLDVDMPELSGFEVCKAFKADPALAVIPIIFITGHDSPQLFTKGFELGAADFISKPPHPPVVLARVRACQRVKMLSDTLRGAVTIDFVTGALTRQEFDTALENEYARAQRTSAPLSLLLAEIDDFDARNAVPDNLQGDACLQAVAAALRSAAHRPSDVLGRHAKARFALLLPETNSQGADVVARRALAAVSALQVAPLLTVSLGVGIDNESGSKDRTCEDLTAAADLALARAKEAGAGKAVYVDSVKAQSPRIALSGH